MNIPSIYVHYLYFLFEIHISAVNSTNVRGAVYRNWPITLFEKQLEHRLMVKLPIDPNCIL